MRPPESERELWDTLSAEFTEIFQASRLPQSFKHALGTLNWVKRLKPDTDLAMEIAAIGHDLDRCKDEWMVKREDYMDEKSFRIAHAQKSAELVCGFLTKYGFNSDLIDRVRHLIANHEYGTDEDTIILMKADVFSFFEYNLPLYYRQKGGEQTKHKINIMYEKLSPADKEKVKRLAANYSRALTDYQELTKQDWDGLNKILRECLN